MSASNIKAPSFKETQTMDRSTERCVLKLATLPAVTAAAAAFPSYALIAQRTNTPIMPGTGTAGILSLFRNVASIFPTVIARQTGRSFAGATTAKKIEAGVESEAGLEKKNLLCRSQPSPLALKQDLAAL